MDKTEEKSKGKLKALIKFQSLHPIQCQVLKSITQTLQTQKKQMFEREEEIDCEYENMRKNEELSKYKEEDKTCDLERRNKAQKTVRWSDNLIRDIGTINTQGE